MDYHTALKALKALEEVMTEGRGGPSFGQAQTAAKKVLRKIRYKRERPADLVEKMAQAFMTDMTMRAWIDRRALDRGAKSGWSEHLIADLIGEDLWEWKMGYNLAYDSDFDDLSRKISDQIEYQWDSEKWAKASKRQEFAHDWDRVHMSLAVAVRAAKSLADGKTDDSSKLKKALVSLIHELPEDMKRLLK